MNSVPNIISGKDLDYLSDIFSWNYGAYKCTKNAYESATDMEIKEMINNASNLFYNNMNKVLDILKNGGINE